MVFRNYEYFAAIVEAGSLTRAAEQLYISQPSLSQYVKRLEANLGVELFDRSTSPLRLTYTGERYYQYVLQLMKLDEKCPTGIPGHQEPDQRPLAAGCSPVARCLPAAGCISSLSSAVSGYSY